MQIITTGKQIIMVYEMGFTPSFYQGRLPDPTLLAWLKSHVGFLVLCAIIAELIYVSVNWQKSSTLFGFSPHKDVAILDLLSFANLYNGKKICTRGYYVESPSYTIIKVSLKEDEFTRSAWVNAKDHDIIPGAISDQKAIITTLCGYFESSRNGEFGFPTIWNHQLTVESFKNEGEPISF